MAKKEVKEEPVLYATVLELKEYYGNLRLTINTPNDIRAITERQSFFDELHKSFTQKVQATELPEHATGEEKNNILNKAANELIGTDSGVNKKDLAIFSPEEFVSAVKDLKLTNKEVGFLNYWLVK